MGTQVYRVMGYEFLHFVVGTYRLLSRPPMEKQQAFLIKADFQE
jgi:hypothetical protein